MAVRQEKFGIDQYLSSIQQEITLIDQQRQNRDKVYKSCLQKYLTHLSSETQQLKRSEPQADKRAKTMRRAFQVVYQSISDGTDVALRSIRRTYESKRKFWQSTIHDYANSDELQIKAQFYKLKQEAAQKYLDAIDERKANKFINYQKLVTIAQPDSTLQMFRTGNRVLEGKVLEGTATLTKWKATHYQDEKQNILNYNYGNKMLERNNNQANIAPEQILKNFMKRQPQI